jgi:hypothetical protein
MFTVEDYLSEFDPKMRDLALKVRQLVLTTLPDEVKELAHAGYKMIMYGLGDAMKNQFAYIAVFRAHVNLGFIYGTSLPDPKKLLEGTGKTLRHVKIKSEKMDTEGLQDLLRAALNIEKDKK